MAGDYRFYAVWRILDCDQACGVHAGPGTDTWEGIEALLPDCQNDKSKCALRRANSLEEAETLYNREAPKHGVPKIPLYFTWWQ